MRFGLSFDVIVFEILRYFSDQYHLSDHRYLVTYGMNDRDGTGFVMIGWIKERNEIISYWILGRTENSKLIAGRKSTCI